MVLYSLYEVVRGVPSENVEAAMRHTSEIVALEQGVGIYVERGVQEAFDAVPGMPTVLGLNSRLPFSCPPFNNICAIRARS